jgi:ABC-2 type transport system permease protein
VAGITGAGIFSAAARAQYAAFAEMRRRMFVNSLRSMRGSFEFGAKILSVVVYLGLGVGIGFGLGYAAYAMTAGGKPEALAILTWAVFALWQIVPVMVASFSEAVDLGGLLRFPLGFGPYTVLYLVFGLFDISTILGGLCLTGIWIGVGIARPALLPWTALVLAVFAAFNILLTRMIFAWIDRWLAQRRTREILSAVFLFLLLSLQLLNPALRTNTTKHGHHRSAPMISRQTLTEANRVQTALPAGLAAASLAEAANGRPAGAVVSVAWLALYAAGAGFLLCVRLRKEYRGENLSEAPARRSAAKSRTVRSDAGRRLAGNAAVSADAQARSSTGPVFAVFEKELHYLLRSGPMLYSLVAPLVILFVFRGGSSSAAGHGFRYALLIGIAYGFLGLTRLIYNSLGAEGAGIQFYFTSPAPIRSVLLGKNLMHLALFGLELALVCTIVFFRFGLPDTPILLATFAWLVFAVPAHLAAGNILSITMAYRMNMGRMARDQGATGNALISMAIQAAILGVGAGVIFGMTALGHAQLAPLVLLVLAAGSLTFYLTVLKNTDRMVASRMESLAGVLAKAAS